MLFWWTFIYFNVLFPQGLWGQQIIPNNQTQETTTQHNTTPMDCNCQDYKCIISGPYKGYYDLVDSQGNCTQGVGCVYKEQGGLGREVCMCDPGDVPYEACDINPPGNLSYCTVKNLVYLIDTSGSMSGSKYIWYPQAFELEQLLDNHEVTIEEYTLMSYLTSVSVTYPTPTPDHTLFETAININSFSGGTELTFAGLRGALMLVPQFSFIVLFSDEIGDDTHDLGLKADIISLRDSTDSTIVFMMIPPNAAVWAQMVTNFQDIGAVYDLKTGLNPAYAVLLSIQDAAVCTIPFADLYPEHDTTPTN